MSAPDIDYDVYATPRLGAVELGDFIAAEGSERQAILRNAKYSRRAHRARAWYAKQEIVNYLTSPKRRIGDIDAAISIAETDSLTGTNAKQEDASASLDCLKKFLWFPNQIALTGKDIIGLDDDQKTFDIGGLMVLFSFAALIRSVDKNGNDRIGGIFLNTRQGKGIGTQPSTIEKRKKAGETVALLGLRQLMDVYSDFGQPNPKDTYHFYVRAQHFWTAPTSYATRLKNIEADAKTITMIWESITPPTDFDPDKAKYHS